MSTQPERKFVRLEGPPGREGRPGEDGVAGSTGIRGAVGTTGFPGFDGEDGLDGFPGVRGADGVAGTAGITGLRGIPGMDGEDGEMGFPGLRGATGATGAPGGGGGSATRVVATAAFPAKRSQKITVGDGAVTTASRILAWVSGIADGLADAGDLVDLYSMRAVAGDAEFYLNMDFLTPWAGSLSIDYLVLT